MLDTKRIAGRATASAIGAPGFHFRIAVDWGETCDATYLSRLSSASKAATTRDGATPFLGAWPSLVAGSQTVNAWNYRLAEAGIFDGEITVEYQVSDPPLSARPFQDDAVFA
jgi:hypothetical protein